MPSYNANTSLELPTSIEGASEELLSHLNDRFLTIASFLTRATAPASGKGSAAGGGSAAGSASGSELILSVPGTLGILTDAAPRVSLAAAVTPQSLVAYLKQAPQGAAFTIQVNVAGASWATLTIAAGAVTSAASSGLGAIAAGALVTVDITAVGVTFPGSDLSVLVQW